MGNSIIKFSPFGISTRVLDQMKMPFSPLVWPHLHTILNQPMMEGTAHFTRVDDFIEREKENRAVSSRAKTDLCRQMTSAGKRFAKKFVFFHYDQRSLIPFHIFFDHMDLSG